MNLKKITVIGGLIVFTLLAFAQEGKDKKKESQQAGDSTTAASNEDKKYNEEEFKKKLEEELEKTLKRIGQEKLTDLSRELLNREASLKDKELEIEKMQQELTLSRDEFQRQLKDFQDKQQSILGCLDKQSELREKRINHMVDVVSNMKPEVAAEVLSVQETQLSVEILGKLDANKVSKIFNLMDKEISARLQKQYMNMKR